MGSSPRITLPDAEKLDVLQRLDQFRHWRSLDDKRYCLVCGKIITGRQIELTGGTRGNGALQACCPTERCNSIPMDWVLPTDEIIAKVELIVAEERKAAAATPINQAIGEAQSPKQKARDGIAWRLRNFAFHFKRAF